MSKDDCDTPMVAVVCDWVPGKMCSTNCFAARGNLGVTQACGTQACGMAIFFEFSSQAWYYKITAYI